MGLESTTEGFLNCEEEEEKEVLLLSILQVITQA